MFSGCRDDQSLTLIHLALHYPRKRVINRRSVSFIFEEMLDLQAMRSEKPT
jgi:hypothetical protein